jgi:hypothetical protein
MPQETLQHCYRATEAVLGHLAHLLHPLDHLHPEDLAGLEDLEGLPAHLPEHSDLLLLPWGIHGSPRLYDSWVPSWMSQRDGFD